MWTGDGRPDELTTKYAKDADVFVTEMPGLDLGFLLEQKYGIPRTIVNFTIDTHHTSNYAVGAMMAEINPRIGLVTHFIWDDDLASEMVAGLDSITCVLDAEQVFANPEHPALMELKLRQVGFSDTQSSKSGASRAQPDHGRQATAGAAQDCWFHAEAAV